MPSLMCRKRQEPGARSSWILLACEKTPWRFASAITQKKIHKIIRRGTLSQSNRCVKNIFSKTPQSICSVCWIIGFGRMRYFFFFFWVNSYFNSPICYAICAPHSCSVFYWTFAQAGNLTAWNPNNGVGVCTGNQAISSSHMSYPTPALDLNADSFSWLHMLKLSMLAGGPHEARVWAPSAWGSRREVSLLVLAQSAALVQQKWPLPDQLTNKLCGHPGRRQM